jgi:hypothetical protein
MRKPDITPRAASAISRLLEMVPEEMKQTPHLATVSWMVGSDEPDFVPGPCIGLHPAHEVPDEYIVDSHGIRVAFNLPDDLMTKYQEYALDYLGGRFLFVERSMTDFLGGKTNC